MSEATGTAVALLVVGLVLGAWALLRIRSGISYMSHPLVEARRGEDPFAFWASVLPMLAVAVALIVFAAYELLAG